MKVLGLISGGKDSIFNLHECVKNGHEIVMLAHISRPKDKGEMDSYMYQTVCSEMASAVAECMGLPLITREISRTPVNKELEYNPTNDDEVEDLFLLIEEAIKLNPEIKGVSSGAIFSTYQKNRVENICERLNLVSLAYLWKRDQKELLLDMINSGMEAVLVKTCAYGLDKSDLLKTIKEMQPKLFKLDVDTQINVCGEGGEFESLTLNCPLYKKRINILDYEVVIHSQDKYTEVAYVKINKYELVSK